MQVAHPAIRLQDTHPIAALAVLIRALDAQHPTAGGLAGGVGGAVRISERTGRRTILTVAGRRGITILLPLPVAGLRQRTGGGQQPRQQRRKRQAP